MCADTQQEAFLYLATRLNMPEASNETTLGEAKAARTKTLVVKFYKMTYDMMVHRGAFDAARLCADRVRNRIRFQIRCVMHHVTLLAYLPHCDMLLQEPELHWKNRGHGRERKTTWGELAHAAEAHQVAKPLRHKRSKQKHVKPGRTDWSSWSWVRNGWKSWGDEWKSVSGWSSWSYRSEAERSSSSSSWPAKYRPNSGMDANHPFPQRPRCARLRGRGSRLREQLLAWRSPRAEP